MLLSRSPDLVHTEISNTIFPNTLVQITGSRLIHLAIPRCFHVTAPAGQSCYLSCEIHPHLLNSLTLMVKRIRGKGECNMAI